MQDIDMSRPGSELFPEPVNQMQYNSYTDVNVGQSVDDPLNLPNAGVKQTFDDAGQGQLSDKEFNFRALREEAGKFKQESEYWRGQAEAYSKANSRAPEQTQQPQESFEQLDWDSGSDVRKAFDTLRQQNESLRSEIRDTLSAVSTKAQYQDWNNMVTQHVPQLTSKNPIFAEMIQKASNPYEAAYLLAELNSKASTMGQQQQNTEMLQHHQHPNVNAQRAIANAQKPQTLSSLGGNGALSATDYYANMSDEDFHKIAARNLANI